MATAEDINSARGHDHSMNERQPARTRGGEKTLIAAVVIRLIALAVVAAIVALVVAKAG